MILGSEPRDPNSDWSDDHRCVIQKQTQREGRGEPTEHLHPSETSFIQPGAFFIPLRPQHSMFPRITANHSKEISKMYKYTFWGNVYLFTRSEERGGEKGESNDILPSIL